MAEEDVLNELEDQCTCWVCFEAFKDPITLLCLHSFCKECTIKVYKRDAQCPFCRRPFALPLPPVNKTLEAIVHGFLNRPKPGDPQQAQVVPDVNMNTEMLQQSVFLDLPNDVIVDIMTLLNPDDVARSALTCTRVNKCTQNGWIWRGFAQKTSPFCNVEKYNKNWKNCYVGLRKRQVGWTGGKAGDFEVITMRGHTNYINRFILSNNRIITVSADRTLKVWPSHKSEAISTFEGHNSQVKCVESDGIKVVSGSSDSDARLWDFATGICTGQFHHGGSVEAVLLDDNQIVTGGTDARLKVWDMRSHEAIQDLGGHAGAIKQIKRDDAGRIVSCSNDAIKVWDLRAAPIDNRIYLGPAPVVNLNVFSAPGAACIQVSRTKIVAGGFDGRVHVHDPVANTQHAFASRHNAVVNAIQCDGSKIVTGSSDSSIKVWDIGRNVLLRTLEDHKGPVHGVQFDDSKIVSCSADNTIKVWKMETGARLYTLLGGSLQARANNPPHPERPGCSGVLFDESSIYASFNALVRNYCFEPTPPQSS